MVAVFEIRLTKLARGHLEAMRPFHRNRILDEVSRRLARNPTVVSERRKVLTGAAPAFEHVQPVWQLRAGDFRVIYDVDEPVRLVVVRAVLYKGRRTTGEIL